MKEKVILAYSGGLDTTAIIPWLKENFDYEVICVCIDCGQGEELDGLEERAKFCGASKLYIEDVVDEFCDEYVVPCVQAHAVYENKYLLGTSMARPVIAKRLVEIARKEGATAICHGATMLLIWGTVNIFTAVISANIRMTVISALTDLFTPTDDLIRDFWNTSRLLNRLR